MEPIKPSVGPERVMRAYLEENLKDPKSLQDLKVSSYFKLGKQNFWRGRYAVCGTYRATNSFGGYIQNGIILVFDPTGKYVVHQLGGSGRLTNPECLQALR